MLGAALMAALGAIGGTAVGWGSDTILVLTALGAALGASASALSDRVKGYRLMQWVRRADGTPAPRGAAFWGELAARFERSLQLSRRETEAERAQTREFLSAIEASPNGVLLLDKNDQIEWCNSVAASHFDLDPKRDIQQRITNLVRDPVFVAYMHGADFSQGVDVPARGGLGTLGVLVRLYGDDKKLVLSQDITERERTETMRRDFVANVSHEIRTPLTVLSGFVESLSTLALTEPERRRVLALMEQQTNRMEALVTDLLTLAQLEGSPRPVADRWVPVAELFAQVQADALALSAGRHELVFEPPEPQEFAGNAAELQSALSNLLSNAVRYTPERGRIVVTCSRRPSGGAALEVSDTGPGIGREHLPRLTERFYRVDGSRSRETGGTGLGLSIVKHVMQRHGGEIDIDSEPGRGSKFRLLFPPSRVRDLPATPRWSASAPSAVEPVVDDHQFAGLSVAPLSGGDSPTH
jgi:two-component system, OmpR family, phosphate regulon sensor histidine kinase PhoR